MFIRGTIFGREFDSRQLHHFYNKSNIFKKGIAFFCGNDIVILKIYLGGVISKNYSI